MTNDEIIYALKRCGGWSKTCDKCVYKGVTFCSNQVKLDAADLIKRQQIEIEKLERTISHIEDYCDSISDKTRAEAIKEFATRLRQEGHVQLPSAGCPIDEDDWIIYKEDVDYIEKEMTN